MTTARDYVDALQKALHMLVGRANPGTIATLDRLMQSLTPRADQEPVGDMPPIVLINGMPTIGGVSSSAHAMCACDLLHAIHAGLLTGSDATNARRAIMWHERCAERIIADSLSREPSGGALTPATWKRAK